MVRKTVSRKGVALTKSSPWKCGHCNRKDSVYRPGIECNACKVWWYASCANVDVSQFPADRPWLCQSCIASTLQQHRNAQINPSPKAHCSMRSSDGKSALPTKIPRPAQPDAKRINRRSSPLPARQPRTPSPPSPVDHPSRSSPVAPLARPDANRINRRSSPIAARKPRSPSLVPSGRSFLSFVTHSISSVTSRQFSVSVFA